MRLMVVRVVVAGALCCLALWAGSVGLLWTAEPYLVFMTGNSRAYTAPFDQAVFQPRDFPNNDGIRLRAVLLTHGSPGERYSILFCQPAGASTQVQMIQHQLKALFSLGYDVFAFDYRGFGASAGTPTEEGLYADATAAYRPPDSYRTGAGVTSHSCGSIARWRRRSRSRNEGAGSGLASVCAN